MDAIRRVVVFRLAVLAVDLNFEYLSTDRVRAANLLADEIRLKLIPALAARAISDDVHWLVPVSEAIYQAPILPCLGSSANRRKTKREVRGCGGFGSTR